MTAQWIKNKCRLQLFKDRAVGFWLGLAAAAVLLVADVLYIALDVGDDVTFSATAFALILVGALFMTLDVLFDWQFVPIVSVALCSVGFGLQLCPALESYSDIINEVNFVGGNAKLAVAFSAVFAVGVIAMIVSTFMSRVKQK